MPGNQVDDLVPPRLKDFAKPVIGVLVACMLVFIGYRVWLSQIPVPAEIVLYHSILAGEPEQNPLNPNQIKGSFTILFQEEPLVADGIKLNVKSRGTAGACLLANLNQWNIPKGVTSCTTNEPCMEGTFKNISMKERKWEGVCIDGACWTRPGIDEKLCDKSPFHNGAPWPPGKHPIPIPEKQNWFDWSTVNDDLGIPDGEPVEWRVLACLNEFDEQTQKDSVHCGRGGPLRMVKIGKVVTIP